MGLQTRKLPRVFPREFQLESRGLGVEILLMLLRSIAPLCRFQRSLSSYSLLLWKTKKRKDTNLQKKVYYNIQHFHFPRYFSPELYFAEPRSVLPVLKTRTTKNPR